jgi:hypothetical protein
MHWQCHGLFSLMVFYSSFLQHTIAINDTAFLLLVFDFARRQLIQVDDADIPRIVGMT